MPSTRGGWHVWQHLVRRTFCGVWTQYGMRISVTVLSGTGVTDESSMVAWWPIDGEVTINCWLLDGSLLVVVK